MGPGHYSQNDVTEAAKALTGWVVNVPYGRAAQRFLSDYEPWEAVFVPRRHYSRPVTILGNTGIHQLPHVLDILLNQMTTAEFVSEKLWKELVGTQPAAKTVAQLAKVFRANYSTMALVEAIAWHREFIGDEAIRAKVRTPIERLVAIAQGFGSGEVDERLGYSLHGMAYLPFNPPSPAGYPRGSLLLGPYQMVHAFDLLAVAEPIGVQDH